MYLRLVISSFKTVFYYSFCLNFYSKPLNYYSAYKINKLSSTLHFLLFSLTMPFFTHNSDLEKLPIISLTSSVRKVCVLCFFHERLIVLVQRLVDAPIINFSYLYTDSNEVQLVPKHSSKRFTLIICTLVIFHLQYYLNFVIDMRTRMFLQLSMIVSPIDVHNFDSDWVLFASRINHL